ncbi:MAG: beta-galactosidase [Candidatus Andersenbacteria bacterium]|nr:beta-galactosidase [bacterium]MDZ4225638.1 beta-galactosidase [Candidatus Andersenbacteria bacterium]
MKKKRGNRVVRWLVGSVSIAMAVVVLAGVLLAVPSWKTRPTVFGASFDAQHAAGLGLDWRQSYLAVLDDLKVKRLRLDSYWSVIEPNEGKYDFIALDYQMDEAAKHGASVILTIGRKQPRWPECHVPSWAEKLPETEQQAAVLNMLSVVVARYKDSPALKMWQLENEPLLDFGGCPPEDRNFLAQEEALVRSLDSHPIMVTDSGELNSWLPVSRYGDVLGATMYRTVWSGRTDKLFSYDYLFPAWIYRAKARLVGLVRGKPVLISELQGEPWGARPFVEMSQEERRASLSLGRLMELERFARRSQLPEAYWWGVEYWYWEKEINNEPAFWEAARNSFIE